MKKDFSDKFKRAIELIDEKNADDPETIFYEGKEHQKEILHSELMTKWVLELDEESTEAQLLAARAHHIRRFDLPRSNFEDGRKGYLKWRKEQAKRHANLVEEILKQVGYEDGDIQRVSNIIQKKNLKTDSQVQTHEDALCLVFLETQKDNLAEKLADDEKFEDVIQKTLKKMSDTGKAVAKANNLL